MYISFWSRFTGLFTREEETTEETVEPQKENLLFRDDAHSNFRQHKGLKKSSKARELEHYIAPISSSWHTRPSRFQPHEHYQGKGRYFLSKILLQAANQVKIVEVNHAKLQSLKEAVDQKEFEGKEDFNHIFREYTNFSKKMQTYEAMVSHANMIQTLNSRVGKKAPKHGLFDSDALLVMSLTFAKLLICLNPEPTYTGTKYRTLLKPNALEAELSADAFNASERELYRNALLEVVDFQQVVKKSFDAEAAGGEVNTPSEVTHALHIRKDGLEAKLGFGVSALRYIYRHIAKNLDVSENMPPFLSKRQTQPAQLQGLDRESQSLMKLASELQDSQKEIFPSAKFLSERLDKNIF